MTKQYEHEQAVLAALRDHLGDWKTLDAIRVHPAVAGHVPTAGSNGVMGQILARLIRRGEAESDLRGTKRIYRAVMTPDAITAMRHRAIGQVAAELAGNPAVEQVLPVPEPESVMTQYDVPGTCPTLTVGVTDKAAVLIGERVGEGVTARDKRVNWITRMAAGGAGIAALQQVLEQAAVDSHRIGRTAYPSELRQALRLRLRDYGMQTLVQILQGMGVFSGRNDRPRNEVIEELARMRDDGEVIFSGPRYKLVDRQAGN